jgi:hypothetical protein
MVYGTLEDFVPSNDAEDSWRKKVVKQGKKGGKQRGKQGHPFKMCTRRYKLRNGLDL